MSELKHTMLSKDTRPICQLVIENDVQFAPTIGRHGVTAIVAVDEEGQMSYVTWFELWKDDLLYSRINANYVSQVLYQEGQPKR